jgi:hypothetical protein
MIRVVGYILLLLALSFWVVSLTQDPVRNTVEAASPTTLPPAPPSAAVKFPLKIASTKRYLEDSEGKPFLVRGDAAWSLIAQLKREDVEEYLRDRRSRGFNTVLVSLIEHYFATRAPANAYGDQPFLSPGNFNTPNEAYFAYVDWVLQYAYKEGFLVLLAPCYSGAGGGSEGWYAEMVANGPEKLRDYGRYVGRRYRQFPNIIWVENGDYNPPNKALTRAVAEGVQETDPNALHTAHNETDTAGIEYWGYEPWLKLNNVYTWGPVFRDALEQYRRTPTLPFILIEGQYENGPGVTPQRLRGQAYHALLSGAAGHVFGNSPIWYFDGTTDYPKVPRGWQKAMADKGSQSMAQLHELFAHLSWQSLEPDLENTFLISGQGSGFGRAVAALTNDHAAAVVYVPDNRIVKLNLALLAGPKIRAQWYDPTNGAVFEIARSPMQPEDAQKFRPAVKNAEGAEDWVLLLKSEKE